MQDSEHYREQGHPQKYSYPPSAGDGQLSPSELHRATPSYAAVLPDSAALLAPSPSPGGVSEYPRKGSFGGSSGSSTAYDEKDTSGESAKHSPTFDLPQPPAVPRQPQTGGWQPGHVTRGSIALLAAAEGKIPKKEGLKMWRSDEHHGTFTAGGRRKTCFRCCCCTLVLAIIVIIGVIAAFLLWVSLGTLRRVV